MFQIFVVYYHLALFCFPFSLPCFIFISLFILFPIIFFCFSFPSSCPHHLIVASVFVPCVGCGRFFLTFVVVLVAVAGLQSWVNFSFCRCVAFTEEDIFWGLYSRFPVGGVTFPPFDRLRFFFTQVRFAIGFETTWGLN